MAASKAIKNLKALLEMEGREAAQKRLMLKVKKMSNGCWEWQGTRNKQGYGRISWGDKVASRVHRVAYEIFKGSFDKSLCVCHTCDNPPCVNPAHLWLGTNLENTRDKVKKGRHAVGEKANPTILKEWQVREIIKASSSGKRFWGAKDLAKRFGVGRTTVEYIAKGKTWLHVRAAISSPSHKEPGA